MDGDNSVINEVDSVKDDSNKVGLSDSCPSDPSFSNATKFNSTAEESVDDCCHQVYYSNPKVSCLKTEFSGRNMQIVQNMEPSGEFDGSSFSITPEKLLNHPKISSRSLLTDYDDSKDTLDKMWDMKTLMQGLKTDYNYPKGDSELKFDEDFKVNYLHSLTTKRSEPQTSSSDQSSSDDKLAVDYYKFELEKLQKIVKVLKDQIVTRDHEISELSEKVEEYKNWKSELDPNRQASVVQYKAESEALLSVNFAKLQAQVSENERLTQRLMKMEEIHREKDDEIKSLRHKISENELLSSRFDRDLKSLEIDKQMLKNSIEEIEKTFRQREMQLKLNLDMEYQSQISKMLKDQDALASLVTDKDTEIEKCKELLKTAQYECSQLLNSILKLKEVLLRKNQEIEYYKEKVIELESKMIANDRTSELKVSKEAQSKLRDRVRQLEKKLEVYEESSKLDNKLKEENLYLRAKLEKLQGGDSHDTLPQHVLELGNQILPLSLANFRDT